MILIEGNPEKLYTFITVGHVAKVNIIILDTLYFKWALDLVQKYVKIRKNCEKNGVTFFNI